MRTVARWLLGLIVVIAPLAVVEWGGRTAISRHLLPTEDAQWIWAAGLSETTEPVRFYLARQFDLPFSAAGARLLTLADEEYAVHVNGTWVGSNRYAPGKVDAYQVGPLLRLGTNTLLFELRSARGIGGLLLSLEVLGDEEKLRIVSDESWSVFRQHRRELFSRRPEILSTESVEVLASPPMGRWGLPREVLPKPTIDELLVDEKALGAAQILLGPEHALWGEQGRLKRGAKRFRWWVTFDWEHEVTGYLKFQSPHGAETEGLVFVGAEPPDPLGQSADTYLIPLAGRRSWTDSQPRRFRYATFVGLGPVQGAEVLLTDPEASLPWMARPGRAEGVFGLETGRLRSPLENVIWSKLQGVPGLTGWEER